jgi:polysaccharide export outer membrane protein
MAIKATRAFGFSVWIAAAATVTGCTSTPEPVIGLAASQTVPELGQSSFANSRPTTYAIRPADQLSMIVFREPDLSLENVRVGVEGSISVPMIGSIPVVGMTPKQIEQDITRRLAAAGLKNPTVSVNITEYASHTVTVEGSVDKPGVYIFQPGARLSTAIALASGPKRTAKQSQVAVFRESPQGIMIAKFDYKQISEGAMIDPILEPGDRVIMGTDGMSQFWQDVLQALPAFGVFAAAGLK